MDTVYDVLVNGTYHSSMWNATPAQVRAYMFDLSDECGSDIVVVQEDSTVVVDELKNYENDDVEFDGNYVVGNKYPDYDEFYEAFADDDINDIEWIDEEQMDYEMADMMYDIARETMTYKTPQDYR